MGMGLMRQGGGPGWVGGEGQVVECVRVRVVAWCVVWVGGWVGVGVPASAAKGCSAMADGCRRSSALPHALPRLLLPPLPCARRPEAEPRGVSRSTPLCARLLGRAT